MGSRALLAAAAAVLVVVPGSSGHTLARTFTGSWQTDWGAMKLTQTGNRVQGTYEHDSGRISGTVSGNLFKGQWTEVPTRKGPNDAGAVEFTLSADGKSFTGRWNYVGPPPTSWSLNWAGTCTSGACLSNTAAAGGGTGGGGGGGGTQTTTTGSSGGSATPPTGTPTGVVLVNGAPFTAGAVRYGSTVDVTNGTLVLKTDVGTLKVNGGGGVPAVFKLLRRTVKKKPLVELRLVKGNFGVCPKRKKSSAAQAPSTTVRQLWGTGKGSFQTRGKYAAATVRGTKWLTSDRCDGTQVKVSQGVVQVTDLAQRREVTVRAGGSYLARP